MHPARLAVLMAATMLAGGNAPPVEEAAAPKQETTAPKPVTASSAATPRVALPGFAAELAETPIVTTPAGWRVREADLTARALIAAGLDGRQAWRWGLVRHYVGIAHGAEAIGLLTLMAQDDPDLPLVPAYRLALGAANVLAGRSMDALTALNHPMLVDNAEACAWRMLVLSRQSEAEGALAQMACARTALTERHGAALRPFLLAAIRSALATGDTRRALQWLGQLGDSDVEANLLRGQAMLQAGQGPEGRLRLARVTHSGNFYQRLDAELITMEQALAHGGAPPPDIMKRLDHIGFVWRGDELELRALRLRYRLAETTHDRRNQLASGAALLRYHPMGKDTGPMMATLQAQLQQLLDPASKIPLTQAAGLFWDYRDLAPNGPEGHAMVNRFATALQDAGLYERAAELLGYQMKARAQDIEKGPLSERIATLQILARRPDLAMRTLRETDDIAYPDAMRWSRQRIQAVVLHLMGKDDAARAILVDMPGGEGVMAEIDWQARDWKRLADAPPPALGKGVMAEVNQALVLRRAVALAMLGRESDLARLRTRYSAAFRGTAAANAFDLVTRPVGSLTPDAVARAMAALPSVSPAGDLADLFELGRAQGG